MSPAPRIAVLGSCITRDLWPAQDQAPPGLLYVSRTSLPSVLSPPPAGVVTSAEPPNGLKPNPHAAVVADLRKLALERLIAHRPTHLILDFIDERFDLLSVGGATITHSWELEVSGYLAQPALSSAQPIPRLGETCESLWGRSLGGLAELIASTPLQDATLILHAAQWAETWRATSGTVAPLPDETEIWTGRPTSRTAHNALLARYQAAFLQVFPQAQVVSAPTFRIADEGHRWGLSPFHYVEEYYAEIRRQLAALGA